MVWFFYKIVYDKNDPTHDISVKSVLLDLSDFKTNLFVLQLLCLRSKSQVTERHGY